MNFDSTFWVAVSFIIFVGVLFYFKVPQKIFIMLDDSINKNHMALEQADNTVIIHRLQGAISALRRLKYLREEMNGTE